MKFSLESTKKALKNTALGVTATILSVGAVQAKEKGVLNHNHTKQESTINPEEVTLLQNINTIEQQFKNPKSKEVHDKKKAYVFITESKLSGNANYQMNERTLESICNDDLEQEFINNQERDYHVLSRDISPFQVLKETYDKVDRGDFVVKNYIPPTDYIIFKLEQGNSPYQHVGTFTIVDMKTKEIKKHTFAINSNSAENTIAERYKTYPQKSIDAIKDLKLNNTDRISEQVIEEFKKIINEL